MCVRVRIFVRFLAYHVGRRYTCGVTHTTQRATPSSGAVMNGRSVIHSTFTVEHNFAQPIAAIYAAFIDPQRKQRWFAESPTQQLLEFRSEPRVGGREITRGLMLPGTPFPGVAVESECIYLEIEPQRHIVLAGDMRLGGVRISTSMITFEFFTSPTGSRLICTHQAAFFVGSDGSEMREAGWRVLFDRLAAQVDG